MSMISARPSWQSATFRKPNNRHRRGAGISSRAPRSERSRAQSNFCRQELGPLSSESVSSRNHQVDRLGAFALLVRFDLERNALSLCQILQSGPLDGGDVNEHITTAIIGLDEAVAAFSIEELDCPSHGHLEPPPPTFSSPPLPSPTPPP